MFVINPDGDKSGGSGDSAFKTSAKFFGKLGLYFVAIRAAHIYFGVEGESTTGSSIQ